MSKISLKFHSNLLEVNELSHWGQVMPYGVMHFGQHRFRPVWHQAIYRTNADLLSIRPCMYKQILEKLEAKHK